MFAGFVKYLPSARMDCTVPRFTGSCSRCAASRDLLRFGWLSSDSVKCKGVSCVQDIEYAAQNRQKRKKPCAAFNTQHRAKVDLELSKQLDLFTILCYNKIKSLANQSLTNSFQNMGSRWQDNEFLLSVYKHSNFSNKKQKPKKICKISDLQQSYR